MLVMHNVKMEMSNVRKKKKPLNVTKILPNLMLVLLNVTIKPSNVKKKKKKTKGITKCDKRKVTSDIGIAQCEDRTVKCEKKIKGITKCDKRTVTCDTCDKRIVTCNKNRTDTMLVLLNITMEPSNLRKK